jgi:hypothetical protein
MIDLGKVKPGDVITRSFQVKYDYQPLEDGSFKEAKIETYSQNFTQGPDAGVPFFIDDGVLSSQESLADWITFEEENFTLDGLGQTRNVTFTINVPQDADPGSKYAAVFLKDVSGSESIDELEQQSSSGSGLNAALGPLIFLTVDGEINSSLQVEGIYTTNIKGDKKGFFFNPPVNVVVALKNDGNVVLAPRGRVIIHKGEKFIDGELMSFELNETNSRILPGTTREFIFTWDDSFINTVKKEIAATDNESSKIDYGTEYNWDKLSKLRIGKYNVTVQFDYKKDDGTSSEVFLGSTKFTVFPWQLLLLILLLLIIIALFIFKKTRKSKKK